jgi:hypothetical protein
VPEGTEGRREAGRHVKISKREDAEMCERERREWGRQIDLI